jgi:hypothetical protein
MNPFDLKVALLDKHAQHRVINPHTHGVEHRPNVWLTNSKLRHLACVGRKWRRHLFASELLFFDNSKEYLTRSYSLEK